jgi:hypothetical protein
MKEASEMISKMKGGAGGKEFQDMMKGMMKSMGSSGKGMFDMNKMNEMMGQSAQKDRMRAKLEQKKFTLETKSANEFVFKLPEDGIQEMRLRMLCKRIEKKLSASKSYLEVLTGESKMQY